MLSKVLLSVFNLYGTTELTNQISGLKILQIYVHILETEILIFCMQFISACMHVCMHARVCGHV